MTAGLTSLPVRSSPTSNGLLRSAAARLAHVHTFSRIPLQAATPSMLAKANKAFKANDPPAVRNALSKQLFPSSSPSASPVNDIREQFKKPTTTSLYGSGASVSSARTTISPFSAGQDSRSSTSQTVSSNGDAAKGSLASLYNNSDPFGPDPGVVDLTGPGGDAKLKEMVYFAEDDFSDDENLDLDYVAPSALPSISLPKPMPKEKENVIPLPATQQIPWSSSPSSHFFPPTSNNGDPTNGSLKRDSSGEGNAFEPPAQKKKRVLPASFRQEPDTSLDNEASFTTPAKPRNMWDATASAIKEQKKQLKSQYSSRVDPVEMFPDEFPKEFGKSHNANTNEAISLSSEQEHVLDLVVNKNKSVFFTGPAGTGKSVLMRAIINKLRSKYARDPERVAVTASTGLAACNIGGITLHSFSGIGLGKEDAPSLVRKIRRNQKAKNRWLRTKCLIIDEVSMVDGDLFDKLSQIGRTIRNNGRPWGGLQLIITGDFFQLPPVPDADKKRDVKFAFDAATWSTSLDHTIGLTQVFRQRDPEFARMLNEMRLGQISQETVAAFKALSRPLSFEDGLDSAELFPTRAQVDGSNERRLKELPGKAHRYDAIDTGDPQIREKLLTNMMAPKSLDLKINSQVMLIKNLDETLVNGTLGKVIAFSDERTFDMSSGDSYEEEMEEKMAKARKKLRGFGYDVEGDSESPRHLYPVVQFMATGGVARVILCQPEEWKVELPNGEVQAKRTQLPLILAWALSIHKAQGQTLERVTVNLGRVFEKGQAYVALSRATSQEGLRVLGFDKTKVMAHPKVVNFYQKLYTAEEATGRKPTNVADFITNRNGVAAPPANPATRKVIELDDEEEAMASYGY